MSTTKFEFNLEECNVISQGLRLKRESLLRSRNKEVTGSQMFHVLTAQLNALSLIETKMFALVDNGVAK